MKRILSIAFVIIGILAIIFAFRVYDFETGYKESNEKYGGDAYTGIQNAAAQTARNVYYLTEAITYSAGSILLIGGLALIIYGLRAVLDEDIPAYSIPVSTQSYNRPNIKSSPDTVVPHSTNQNVASGCTAHEGEKAETDCSANAAPTYTAIPNAVPGRRDCQIAKPVKEYGENEFRPGKTYFRNDEVIFEGKHYVCIIEEHKSTVWNPKQKAHDWKEV